MVIYQIIGIVYDLEPLSQMDDFYLMDAPINPCNAPSTIVFPKIRENPEEVLATFTKRLERGHRCFIKMKKIFGKYYFQKLTDIEYEKWVKTNTAVMYDVKDDKGVIEWGLHMKRVCEKDVTACGIRFYYFPSLNNDTESAFMSVGHHTHQDGVSQMQSFYKISDDTNSEYPFLNRKPPTLSQWVFFYLITPVAWY